MTKAKNETPEQRERRLAYQREYQREWRVAHPEKVLAIRRKWYKANADLVSVRMREARLARLDEFLNRERRWRAANPDQLKETARNYRLNNLERMREYSHQRRAREAAVQSLPISLAALTAKFAYHGDRCWMCGGAVESIDHVKPIAKGGAHLLANVRPACRSCNTRKKDHWFGVAALDRFRRAA